MHIIRNIIKSEELSNFEVMIEKITKNVNIRNKTSFENPELVMTVEERNQMKEYYDGRGVFMEFEIDREMTLNQNANELYKQFLLYVKH